MEEPAGKLVVRDAATMRALAHPARVASLERLMRSGPATATELGELAGLSPSAMSYHLRMLEKAGLISTAPGRGDGRERVWQSTQSGGWSAQGGEDDTPEDRAVSKELLRSVLSVQDVRLRRWLDRADESGRTDGGYFTETLIVATEDEVHALGARISALISEFAVANRPRPPAGAVPRRVEMRSFPEIDDLPGGDVKD